MAYSLRSYRSLEEGDLRSFRVTVKETDLLIRVDAASYRESLGTGVEEAVYRGRLQLEEYIKGNPEFRTTLKPYLISAHAPEIVFRLAQAANPAGVGPMAAVAGLFAELAGEYLETRCREILVENGGDIFMLSSKKRRIAILAGPSPFSGRLALEVPPHPHSLGICTSSGTVGPSLSMGKADAAVVLALSTPLADAVATGAANRVRSKEDLKEAVSFACGVPGVLGGLIIMGDALAVQGRVNLVPLSGRRE